MFRSEFVRYSYQTPKFNLKKKYMSYLVTTILFSHYVYTDDA